MTSAAGNSAADKLRDLHADGTWLAATSVMDALADIITVIAAAEEIIEHDTAALTNDEHAMSAMWDAVGDLHSTVAALNARLTELRVSDTSDGGAA